MKASETSSYDEQRRRQAAAKYKVFVIHAQGTEWLYTDQLLDNTTPGWFHVLDIDGKGTAISDTCQVIVREQ